ncbi:hypothetical protein Tco_1470716, partial [Tanacetum coccineum]
MEKAPTEPNLSITSNDINIELKKEFLVELRKNIYHETYNEDVVDHIAKLLKMVDLIYVPGVDSHQLRMKDFSLSLAYDAKNGGLVREMEKSPLGRNLLRRSSVDSIPNHTMEKMKLDGRTKKVLFHAWMNGNWNKRRIDDSILRSNNTTTDSFFKPYLITHGKSDTEKEDEQSQTKRKYSNTSNSINEQPNKRRTLEAKKYRRILVERHCDSWGVGAASSVTGVVWLDGSVDGGCKVDGCVCGDKDGEDVILEGDDLGAMSMVRNSGMSTSEYPLKALFILMNNFCVSLGVGK